MTQRDIILVPFPFSDQSGQKVRPALVISNDKYNSASDDVIVCAMTTNIRPSKYLILLDSSSLESGILHEKCAVKAESLLKIQKPLILKTIGTVNMRTLAAVINAVKELLNPA